MASEVDHITVELLSAGEMLKNELRHLGLTQKQFAEVSGISASHLNEIIKGHRDISIKLAEKLQAVLAIPVSVWLEVQAKYNISRSHLSSEDEEERKSGELLSEYDAVISVKELFHKLNLVNTSNKEKIDILKTSYLLPDPSQLKLSFGKISGWFRKSAKQGLDSRMIVTWIVLARYEARRIDVNSKFDRGSCLELTTELRTIFHENSDTLKRVTQVMSSHGIRFSVVDKLEHASIDGYSYIDTEGVPVIVVTLRHKKIDFFAFTVLHEVCHVYKHLNSENNNMVSLSDYDNETVEEEEANAFASNVLIPQALWRIAPEVPMNPFVIQRRYTLWAEKNHLNKWIVLGRVSHETGMYKFKTDESRLIH